MKRSSLLAVCLELAGCSADTGIVRHAMGETSNATAAIVPSIDADTPASFRTATFALG
jgi:hypothetical protein